MFICAEAMVAVTKNIAVSKATFFMVSFLLRWWRTVSSELLLKAKG
jgi:hypothetical protein